METQQIRVQANFKKSSDMTHRGAPTQAAEKFISISKQDTMKAQAGFTLVELMIVVGIIGIVLAIATMNFKQWNDKYTVESYTKEIYSILMRARNDAANTNTQVRVALAANLVTTHQDADGDGVVDAGEPTTTKSYPSFALNSTVLGGLPTTIIFDRRGMTGNQQTLSVTGYSPNASPGVDCIVVAATRINIGVMTGGACVQQ